MSVPTKVLIVDDHALFRTGLVSVFNRQDDFTVVGEAGSIEEAVSKARSALPDLVLMDVGLPDGDGLEALDQILDCQPETQVVFVTVHESEEIAFTALRRGAKGYLVKDIDVDKLIVALRALRRGEMAISRELSSRYIEEITRWVGPRHDRRARETMLTPREMEIMAELSEGYSNQQIAARLHISPNTVKVHVNNISHKLNLSTRKDVVSFARRHGFDQSS